MRRRRKSTDFAACFVERSSLASFEGARAAGIIKESHTLQNRFSWRIPTSKNRVVVILETMVVDVTSTEHLSVGIASRQTEKKFF